MKTKKILVSWDECEIIDREAERLMEDWKDIGLEKQPTEEEAREMAMEDGGLFDVEWDFEMESLTELLKTKYAKFGQGVAWI